MREMTRDDSHVYHDAKDNGSTNDPTLDIASANKTVVTNALVMEQGHFVTNNHGAELSNEALQAEELAPGSFETGMKNKNKRDLLTASSHVVAPGGRTSSGITSNLDSDL